MMNNTKKHNDALEFLKAVKVAFQHDMIKYNEFRKLLIDLKDGKFDKEDVKERVKELFKEHTDLILGFNTFMPKEYQITHPSEIKDGLAFLTAVEDVFQDERETYLEFLQIMMDLKYERIDMRSVVVRVMELFKAHTNLILEFNVFLPTEYKIKFPFQLDVHETTGDQYKVDASHILHSNHREYYDDVSECDDNFTIKSSKRSKRQDFSSILKSGMLESKNYEDVAISRCNEGFEKSISKKRKKSNTSRRVEFDVDDTASSNKCSKKKITKREVMYEISNKSSNEHSDNSSGNNNIV